MAMEGQWLLFNQIAPIGLHQEVNLSLVFFLGGCWIWLEDRHENLFSVWETWLGFELQVLKQGQCSGNMYSAILMALISALESYK